MGYLLKEALKSLCGVNQWSYAVFWKIGCQNPKLLIWEEFYYEPLQISSLPNNFENGNHESASTELRDHWISPQVHASQNGAQVVGERVHLLIDKMMMANQVNVVGEGLVGRAAFTGNYQWIVLGSYNENAQPTEVITEIRLQFLAGMQTIAVIPIFPHGVVQLGSSLAIMENGGFVHDVKSLILQLSCVPSALVSDNYPQKDSAQIFATPLTNLTSESVMDPYVNFMSMNSHSTSESFIPQRNLSFSSKPSPSAFTRSRDNLKTMSSRFQIPEVSRDSFQSNPDYCVQEARHVEKTKHSEISSTLNDYGAVTSVRSEYTNRAQATAWDSGIVGAPKDDYMTRPHANMSSAQVTGFGFHHADSTHNLLPRGISHEHYTADMHYGNHFPTSENPISGNLPVESSDGNDLFDVLGADFKNKLLSRDDKQVCNEAGSVMKNQFKHMGVQDPNSDFYPNYQTNSESGVFSVCGSDNLLDAMVSGVNSTLRQMSEDSMSCRTTLSKISGSPVLNSSRICCQTQDQFTGLSKRLGAAVGTSSGPPCARNDAGSGSQTSSIYGSQISSWVEQGSSLQYDTSISTANSKKPNEAGKSNRKRLKPGENPRPRPKDRQMIQDRVKELREIVPNGAKCSIDSLLERTIKHMLFLQSVTKHADKLKQAVEPKITGKEGGFLLKDNFEGGATWAFEVGSQSMVCPIVVEDLNPPRQLLVEMLCEERGSFLEIADIIRGLGLTILKGVMEARNDKVWARFAVEANRDVTRMEIFISLVQLLNQTEKSSTGPVHPIQQQPVGTVLCPEPSSI